jgi:hypothetical protein
MIGGLCRCLRTASLLCWRCNAAICTTCASARPVCATCGAQLDYDLEWFEEWSLERHLADLDRSRLEIA